MPSQKCRKCGEEVEGEDLGDPCDCYYCDCGNSWIDSQGWIDRKMDYADYLRKRRLEDGY